MDNVDCGVHGPNRWVPDVQAKDKRLGWLRKHHLHPSGGSMASSLKVSTVRKKSVGLLLVGTLFVFSQAASALSSVPSSASSGCHYGHHQPSKTPQSPTHECCALGHAPASLPTYSSDFGSSSQIVSDIVTRLSLEFSRPVDDRALIRTSGPPLVEPLRI